MRLQINQKEKIAINTWRLNNILLNNQRVTEEIKRGNFFKSWKQMKMEMIP